MIRKILYINVWFIFSFTFLIISLTLINPVNPNIQITKADHIVASAFSDNSARQYLTNTGKLVQESIVSGDAREILLDKFLAGSPLYPYSNLMVYEADKYGIDFRLIPAIAMCESNLGKRIPSSDSYNAFGISVYTGQQDGAKFKNWETSLLWVYEFIHDKFINKSIIDIKDIGAIWAPPSVEKGNSWANCVESFMRHIQ
jgi:hypothetical protein